MQHARPNRLRRAVAYAALAALLGVVTLVLSQCTMVGDVTGLKLDRNGATNCTKDCNDANFLALQACKKNHETSREQCKLLPNGPEQGACLDAATAAHAACNAQANADKVACQNNCHRQGSGSAG